MKYQVSICNLSNDISCEEMLSNNAFDSCCIYVEKLIKGTKVDAYSNISSESIMNSYLSMLINRFKKIIFTGEGNFCQL